MASERESIQMNDNRIQIRPPIQLDSEIEVNPPTTPPVPVQFRNNPKPTTNKISPIDESISPHQTQITPPFFTPCQTLAEVFERYEIGERLGKKLDVLKDFKIVFILDDSSSMEQLLGDSPLLKLQPRVSRWHELQYFTNIAFQLANFYDTSGATVYLINKPPQSRLTNTTRVDDLARFFVQATPPRGFTPLSDTLRRVLGDFDEAAIRAAGKSKLLTVIVTDGEPTDVKGDPDIEGFRKCLNERASNVFTNVIACTDQMDSMTYLNGLDRGLKRLDVIDDYRSEKAEVMVARGKLGGGQKFTYGDYVCKALIGAADVQQDRKDEKAGAVKKMLCCCNNDNCTIL
jgi:hypothetical protein